MVYIPPCYRWAAFIRQYSCLNHFTYFIKLAVAAARGRDEFVEALVQAGAAPDKQVIMNGRQGEDGDHNMFSNICNVYKRQDPMMEAVVFHGLAMSIISMMMIMMMMMMMMMIYW